MIWSFLLPALAAPPHFEADAPSDAVLATRAWTAAEQCTGRTAPSTPTIRITRSVIPGGWLGRAHVHDEGLERLDVSAPPARVGEVIVHEIAHAWVAEGEQALVEGAAELLADCIVAHAPGLAPLQFDDGRDLVALTDLRTWGIAAEGRPLAMDGARTDAYLGASRLLRTAALVIGEELLWTGEPLTFEGLERWLEAAGPRAEPVLAVVKAPPSQQRVALRDRDLDGLTDLAESLLGTDPTRFDTDGDGWWDGATAHPEHAVAVPLDGTWACAGHAEGPVRALPGGNLRGLDAPGLHTRVTESGAVLVRLDAPNTNTSGGLWATVPAATQGSAACTADPHTTVVADDPALVPFVAPFAAALQAPIDAATGRFGMAPRRVAVVLGGDVTRFDGQTVQITSEQLHDAVARDALPELAATVAALPRVWFTGDATWRDAVALGRSLAH